MEIQIRQLSWQMVEAGIKILAVQLQGKKIYGIPRGGQLVATMLAYHGCILVSQVYHSEIIVDDIACTGATLKGIREYHLTQKLAVLVKRGSCSVIPDYFAHIFNTTDYILFPWESRADAEKLVASGRFTDQNVDVRLSESKLDVQEQKQLINGHELDAH